jgi:hypothetical protein
VELWIAWWNQVRQLRPAFNRTRTFIWFAVALAATCVRSDLIGVTSFVRALGLQERCYNALLGCFHSTALDLDALTRCWVGLVRTTLQPFLYTVRGASFWWRTGSRLPKLAARCRP